MAFGLPAVGAVEAGTSCPKAFPARFLSDPGFEPATKFDLETAPRDPFRCAAAETGFEPADKSSRLDMLLCSLEGELRGAFSNGVSICDSVCLSFLQLES